MESRSGGVYGKYSEENKNNNIGFTPAQNAVLNAQPKLTIDKFRLISVLGRGHFGKVIVKKFINVKHKHFLGYFITIQTN